MNREYFITFLEYDNWANNKIAKVLVNQEEIPSKCKILFHHIAAATDAWLSRVNNTERCFSNLFEESSPEDIIKMLNELFCKWIDFVKEANDFDKLIKYKNTKGVEFENTLSEILTHLSAHGNYHRGQINQLLRQNGIEPAAIDYILYKRQ
jgi:uncharacterized damage-inducible protein DinB